MTDDRREMNHDSPAPYRTDDRGRPEILSLDKSVDQGSNQPHGSQREFNPFSSATIAAHTMNKPRKDRPEEDFIKQSSLYQEFLAEREEILKYKWLESEKAGYDIGFERALLDWIRKHRDNWRASRRAAAQKAEQKKKSS